MTRAHTRQVAGAVGIVTTVLVLSMCVDWSGGPDPAGPRTPATRDAGSPAHGPLLEGQVVDINGAAVAGARVSLEPAPPDQEPLQTVTDANGRFALPFGYGSSWDELSASGPTPDLLVRAAGYATTAMNRTETAEPIIIVLDTATGIRGQLVAAEGPPPKRLSRTRLTLAGSGVWPPRELPVDGSGTFEVTDLPEGIYELSARLGPLFARTQEAISVGPGQVAEVSLALRRGASASLSVTDADSGAPLPMVQVRVTGAALSAAPATTRTDRMGVARVHGLDPSRKQVSLTLPGYVPIYGAPLTLDKAAQSFTLTRAARVRGRVLDDQGAPVAGARLEVRGQGRDGRPIYLPVGPAGGSAASPIPVAGGGLPTAGESLGVTRGPVPKVPLTPPPQDGQTAVLTAPPAGEEGVPAEPSQLLSDLEGHFEIDEVPPGTLSVFASSDEHAPGASEVLSVAPGQSLSGVSIVLPSPAGLTVRTQQTSDEPAAGVALQLLCDAEVVPRIGTTDADGQFQFERVAGDCDLSAYPVGRPEVHEAVTLEPGERLERILLVGTAGRQLSGRVFDERHRPVSAASVSVLPRRAAGPRLSPVTVLGREDGTFEAVGLPPPPYTVSVRHHGYAQARVRVASASDDLEITLVEGHRLEGHVRDAQSERPIEGVRIQVRGGGTGEPPRSATTGAEGHFEFRDLGPGSYAVSVDDPRHVPVRTQVAVTVDPRDQQPLALALTRVGSASGTVVDRIGQPVGGATVERQRADAVRGGKPTSAQTDAQGRFRLAGLAPGDLRLVAKHAEAGEGRTEREAQIRPGEDLPGLVIRLPGVDRGGTGPTPAPEAATGPASPEAMPQMEAKTEAQRQPEGAPHASQPAADTSRIFTRPALSLSGGNRGVQITDAAPVARAIGIEPGDELLTVDGERVLSAAQGRSMLRGTSGSRTRLGLRRAGRGRFTVVLTRP